MDHKIVVNDLVKVFGSRPKLALRRMKEGWTKEEILEKTGQTVGVDRSSLYVDEGEIFVIMGLSGSGKSTLVRCLNLLNKPTSGEIIIDGEDIVKYNKRELKEFRQQKIAMVFQNFGLFPHRTVLENIEYGLEIRKVEKEERRKIAMRCLEDVGLDGWADKYPNELSGGMQQRVGLARALANDPDILLMDEPFSALDPLIRRDMQSELLDIQSRLKKTIIFITHDINEAFKLGDRVAVMRDGVIEQIGTPEEILTNPSNGYIKDFIQDIDRVKVIQAKNIMEKPDTLIFTDDKIQTALNKMEQKDISSAYVVDKDMKLEGVVTVDDCAKAVNREGYSLEKILKHDYYSTDEDAYIEDLIGEASTSEYPIAVTNGQEKLLGIIVRSSILAGLL